MLGADAFGPRLHTCSGDFDSLAADAAYQVMVVVRRAGAVERLALRGTDDVNFALARHRLQVAIDGCQADGGVLIAQAGVKFLGTAELGAALQRPGERGALAGGASGAHRGCTLPCSS